MRWHRTQVRKRQGATRDMRRARMLADFAGEAAAQDIDTLSGYGDAKKLALVGLVGSSSGNPTFSITAR